MNRQYSLFSARVKVRREKFASTRKSLSETWDQSFCDDESRVPGFPDLPSPTIGEKDPHFDAQFQSNIITQDSAAASLGGRELGESSQEPSPRSSGDPAVPYSIWKRHVGVQCNLFIHSPRDERSRPTVLHQLHQHRHHPYHIEGKSHLVLWKPTGPQNTIRPTPRRSRSFDWSLLSSLWEPFCDILEPSEVSDTKYFCVTLSEIDRKRNLEIQQTLGHSVQVQEPISTVGSKELVTCDHCLSLTSLKDEIDTLTSNLVQDDNLQLQGRQISIGVPISPKVTAVEITRPISISPEKIRPQRPSLAFTLPFPPVSNATVPVYNLPPPISLAQSFNVPASSSTKATGTSAASSSTSGIAAATQEQGRGKSSTLPTIDSKHIVAIRNAEKRRRFFARKQTNSAPDSFEASSFLNATTHGVINTTRRLCGNCKEPVTNCLDGVLRATRREKADPTPITPTVEVWESEIRTARCGDVNVSHVSELDFPDADPPCHFCCEQASTAIHDESRLQIVSGGLVRSRDGSARSGSAPYINLPSPNVQAENGPDGVQFGSIDLSPSMSQTLSPGSHHLSHCHSQSTGSRGSSVISPQQKTEDEDPLVGPPASSLTRRPALVPPKIISDVDFEIIDAERDKCSSRNGEDNTSPRNRRSSIVVIPPMQICPGDLLVYGKVLSQRKSLLGTAIESPSPVTSMFEPDNTPARKGRTTWSLLKLFERSSRAKCSGSGTLEEVMSIIQPCDFSDPKLSRFKGMCWSDFVLHVVHQKNPRGSIGTVESSPETVTITLPTVTGKTVGCETLVVSSTSIASATVTPNVSSSSPISPPGIKIKEEIPKSSPKPLVRKRMGLMRTMSDRCLERRFTPALWKATAGFQPGEKLMEVKETESTASSPSNKPLTKLVIKPSSLATTSIEKDILESIKASVVAQTRTLGPSQPEDSPSDPEIRQKMRQKEALWDLFQSECSFLYDHLMVLKNVFLEPLKRIQVEGFAMYAEPELLFGNLDELCCVTYGFCKEFIFLLLKLTDILGDLSTTEVLAKLFEPSSKARAMSQAYHRYALNYINALNYLETLRRHAEFGDFEKFCMKDPRCKKLQLTDLLVSPVQHIMKVPLILKDIQSRTNEPQEKELIVQILEIQENSIRELDDKMRWLKNFERLLEIQRNIVWPSILEMEPKTWVPDFLRTALGRQPCDSIVVSPRRQIIHEGLLQLWDTGKPSETYVILFDDMLLITRRKKGLSKKKSSLTENWATTCGKSGSIGGSGLETNHRYIVYRQPISLDRFFIHDIGESENTTAKLDYAFVLVSMNRFQQIVSVHTFQAPTDQIKSTWLLKMKTTQDKWKRTLQNTVFRGVRTSTDSGQSNVSSAILGSISKSSFLRHET